MSRIDRSIKNAAEILGGAGIPEPVREAVSLLMLATDREKAFIYGHPEYELTNVEAAALDEMVTRRARREPLQYISGSTEFYGRRFAVGPGVLIPRPETELLVEEAVEFLAGRSGKTFYEVGPGSGCIAISILAELTGARGSAADLSSAAVEHTRRNAELHGVADRLNVCAGDLFSGATERFDLVISNPPYIAADEMVGLQREVRDFEPREALTDGGDGLGVIRAIVDSSPDHLVADGALLMEIGAGQAGQVRQMLERRGFGDIDFRKDLQGIERTVTARRKGNV
ncbi:MAG: peptide chain release factor N(5)-glutamine methyltransferase [Blastocatellia bacterium]|nr:peptide chain release factor N(5)-glutamine methyltransferase [Blastocatellia bacterium]